MTKRILLKELLLRYKEEITPTKKGAYREGNRINQSRVFSVGHVDNVTKAFKKACVDIGITDMRFHDTRHEATSRFFELCDKDGNYRLSLMEVMSITGHKTVTQIKLYTHLRSDILARKLR